MAVLGKVHERDHAGKTKSAQFLRTCYAPFAQLGAQRLRSILPRRTHD